MEGLFAAIPILWMVFELGFIKKSSTLKVSIHTLFLTITLAMLGWRMPVNDVMLASVEGALMAIWPISLVVIAAIFLYNICDETEYLATIRQGITSISQDKYMIVLIVVWGFGSFIEGIAGFGTSIAVSSTMLNLLGFPPFLSALLAIVANPISSVFGSLGVQMPTLAKVTNLPAENLAINSVYVMVPLVICTPFVLLYLTRKGLHLQMPSPKIWGAALISGIVFSVTIFTVVKYMSSDLAGVLGALAAMLILVLCSCFTRTIGQEERVGLKERLIAWAPFILCFVLLLATSKVNAAVYSLLSSATFSIRMPIGTGESVLNINILQNATIWIFLAGIIGGIIQRASIKDIFSVFVKSFRQMATTVLTLVLLLAISRIMFHSGMIINLAHFMVGLFGLHYILIVPFLGSIGAFITGSATSANVLLGGLQVEIANALEFDPSQFMGLSIVGGTIGKMVSPQNIEIGLVGVSLSKHENKMFLSVIKWYLLYIGIVTLLSLIMLIMM